MLDVSDLTIEQVNVITEGGKIPVNFFISNPVTDIGSKLTIELPTKTSGDLKVSITYKTSPKASGLQWLTPENTLGKKHPYMYSQCQVNFSKFAQKSKKDEEKKCLKHFVGNSCAFDCAMSRYGRCEIYVQS